MTDILVADIGGTKSRIGFARPGERPRHAFSVLNDEVSGLEEVIARALDGVTPPPQAAVLAVAAAVSGDDFTLTNRNWRIRPAQLAARFGIAHLRVVNDFEALAWALPRFQADDLRPLGDNALAADGVRVALGPGTGMGVAALVPCADDWQVVSSEAGHVSFGAANPDEEPIFHRLMREHGPLSAESLVSGRGLPRLHAALHPGAMMQTPEMLMTQARAGSPDARASIAMFVRLLGRFAGDMALAFKATGGVYISGGVARALGELIDARLFRAAFERHPPYEALLKTIPTSLIVCPQPGLIGAAALAERLLRAR